MERTAARLPTVANRPSQLRAVAIAHVFLVGVLGACGAKISGQELSRPQGQRRGVTAPSSLRGLPVQFRTVAQDKVAQDKVAQEEAAPKEVETDGNKGDHSRSAVARKEPAPLPLVPPRRANSSERESSATSSPVRSSITTFASLCLIVGCACAVLWLARRGTPVPRGRLPSEVFETLGKAQLSPRLEVHLLRVGGKVVLVGSSASAANALLEISDVEEVEKIVAACVPGRAPSVAASMRQAFSRLDVESPAPASPAPRTRRYSPEVADA